MGYVETAMAGVVLMCLWLTVAADVITIEVTGEGKLTITTDAQAVPECALW